MRLTRKQTKALRNTGAWTRARNRVLERDNWTCQGVFLTNGNRCDGEDLLHVHHIVPLHTGGDPYSPHNLITLCEFCHQAIHSRAPDVTFALPTEATRIGLIEADLPHDDGAELWRAYEARKRARGGEQCPGA